MAGGCGGAEIVPAAPAAPRQVVVAAPPPAPEPPPPEEHWYFEWLSQNGKRALLRRLDGDASTTLQTRVVDVDSGETVREETFPTLGKAPFATIGHDKATIAELDALLEEPSFGEDLVRGADLAGVFPFGSCGRLSASKSAIAFNAGDWLYVADRVGHVRRRVTEDAAYDPRFTPDGKHLIFRRASGMIDRSGRARYELNVVPADLSAPPRSLRGTAGARDRFAVDEDARVAVAVASQEPTIKTCVLSIGLRPPFSTKRVACLDGAEQLVESVISPRGRFVAMTTQSDHFAERAWRLRVVAVRTGKVILDAPASAGMMLRAISDGGLLVQSGVSGVLVDDVVKKKQRAVDPSLDLGHRGFFRAEGELVVVRGSSVGVVDLGRE